MIDLGVAFDRLGRRTSKEFIDVLKVVDRNPDLAHPVVSEASASKSTVDVRTASATVTVSAKITDDASGVDFARVCGGGECGYLERVSGSLTNGGWRTTVTIPKGTTSGEGFLEFDVRDHVNGQNMHPVRLPLTTVGVDPPKNEVAPTRHRAAHREDLSRHRERSRRGADVVHATDAPDEGVESVYAWIGKYGDVQVTAEALSPYQGTRSDGWWKLTFTFPQGVPPGRYAVEVVSPHDGWHSPTYEPPASTYGASGALPIPPAAVQTTDGQPWDGVITVVRLSLRPRAA